MERGWEAHENGRLPSIGTELASKSPELVVIESYSPQESHHPNIKHPKNAWSQWTVEIPFLPPFQNLPNTMGFISETLVESLKRSLEQEIDDIHDISK